MGGGFFTGSKQSRVGDVNIWIKSTRSRVIRAAEAHVIYQKLQYIIIHRCLSEEQCQYVGPKVYRSFLLCGKATCKLAPPRRKSSTSLSCRGQRSTKVNAFLTQSPVQAPKIRQRNEVGVPYGGTLYHIATGQLVSTRIRDRQVHLQPCCRY